MDTTPHIHGSAVSMSWADRSRSLEDLIFDAVTSALANAGTTMDMVDSVVLAAHDLIDGRSLSSMVTAPAAGAYLRDEIRLADDGLAALSLGAARISSGDSALTVVAAWGRASEADFLRTSRAAMDPFTLQPLRLSEVDLSAMRCMRWIAEHGTVDESRALAAERRAGRARANPRALRSSGLVYPLSYPLRPEEAPMWADVVAAVLVGAEPAAVRIAGVGHGTDLPNFGERDLLALPALRAAAAAAAAEAALDLAALDLFELDGFMLSDEILAVEALGLCAPGEGWAEYAASDRINRSGGAGAGWCFPAMGLVRFCEAHAELSRNDGFRTALATGCAPVGGQTNTAIILQAV